MEEKLFFAKLADMVNAAENGKIKFFGFLSENEAANADEFLSRKSVNYSFFGGYGMALRRFLCVYPDWCEPQFPITALTFSFRKSVSLSHRDFLGALMSVGITRQSVGDILIENGRAVAFISSEISEYIKVQITKVANEGVTVSDGFCEPLPEVSRTVSLSDTVASDRVDCVVAALGNMSRSAADEIISDGFVSVNSKTVLKPTVRIKSGDRISIRKKGRFIIASADELSKKQRIILKYEKYI